MWIIPSFVSAQSSVDSLKIALETQIQKDRKDVHTAELLTQLYLKTKKTEPFLSLQYAARALEIYSLNDDTVNIALMHRYIGDNYFSREIYNMAMDSYTKSYDLYSSVGDELQEGYSKLKIGNVYLIQNLEKNAGYQFYEALEIFKKENDKKGISFSYEKIADIKLKEYSQETAMKYLDSALILRRSLRNDELIALSYENMANAHLFNENYDEAENFLEKSIAKYKATNNKIKVADIYLSLGSKFISEEEYTQAKQNLLKSLAIYNKYNILDKIAETYNKMGYISYKTGNNEKAGEYAEKSLIISKSRGYLNIEKESYRLLSDVHSKTGRFESALKYMEEYSLLNNQLIDDERRKQSTELQVNLATQKKEQEIKLLKKNKQLQDIKIKKNEAEQKTLYYGFALMALVLIFAAFFGYYFYKTNKITKAANNLLIEKNEHILKQSAEIESKNSKITSSLNYASRIQRAMLPKIKEIKEDIPKLFVMLSPKEAVSGDFFWYGKTKDIHGNDKFIITAVDCTGHGVPGAFMSMIGDAYLNQIVYQQKIVESDKILHELHKGINRALKQGKTNNTDGMDMSLCIIDPKENTVEFAGAKNPLVYFNHGEINLIKGNSDSIGGFNRGRKKTFTKHIIKVEASTQFYIYSDGFQDQFGGEGNKKYMARKFRNFLQKIHKLPIEEQAVALAVELDDWKGEQPQMDDIMVIGFTLDIRS